MLITLSDVGALTVSYLLAMLVRYGNKAVTWQWQFYNTWFVITLFILFVLLQFQKISGRHLELIDQDPADLIAEVLHLSVECMAILVGILFALNQSRKISRLMLGYWFIGFTVCDGLFRFILRNYMKKKEAKHEASRRIIGISTSVHQDMISKQIIAEAKGNRDIKYIGSLTINGSETSSVIEQIYASQATEAYIYLPTYKQEQIEELCDRLANHGISVHIGLGNEQIFFSKDRIETFGKSAAISFPLLNVKCKILGVNFNVTNPGTVAAYICSYIDRLRGKYVCMCNVHTTVTAVENKDYLRIQNGAIFTLADGAPIAKIQRLRGFKMAQRVAGPDLMEWMFESTMDGKLSHYFYGSTNETLFALEKVLRDKYPKIDIRGLYSPPFRPLTKDEEIEDVRRINESGADLVWIGLGAPKQEEWMKRNASNINGLVFGVGAGFNFHAGTVQRAPRWVQRIGMEWFYRLLQEPSKLFRRYLVTNMKFVFLLLKEGIYSHK